MEIKKQKCNEGHRVTKTKGKWKITRIKKQKEQRGKCKEMK